MTELEKSKDIEESMLFSDNETVDIADVRYTKESAQRIIDITDYDSIRKLNEEILKNPNFLN